MKPVALVIGVILLAIGVAGFVPALTPNGVLFGVMPMDALRSALFAMTGLVGIAIGLTKRRGLPTTSGNGRDLRSWR